MKKSKIKIPIYGCNVHFVVAKDFLKAGRKFKEELELDANSYYGLSFKLKGDCLDYIIMVKPKYKKSWDIISHEVLHAVNHILEDRGVKCSLENDEAQAYLLSYILNKIQYK